MMSTLYREVFRARTATAEEYVEYARRVGVALDEMVDAVFAGPGGTATWSEEFRARFAPVDDLWNHGPLAPVQHKALDEALGALYDAISSHEFIAVYRSKELAPEDTARFLDEYEAKMRQYRGSWRIFLRERL